MTATSDAKSANPRYIVHLGSCRSTKRRGLGAWSFRLDVVKDGKTIFTGEDSGVETPADEERLELVAAIYALEYIAAQAPGSVHIVTNFRDIYNTGTRLNSGLKTRIDLKANANLWADLSRLMAGRDVSFAAWRSRHLPYGLQATERLAREAVERQEGTPLSESEADYLIHIGVVAKRWAASVSALRGGSVIGHRALTGEADEAGGIKPYLVATIAALDAIPEEAKSRPNGVCVVVDSTFLVSGMNVRARMWKAASSSAAKSAAWKYEGKPVQHRELWETLLGFDAAGAITWRTPYDDSGKAAIQETLALIADPVASAAA